MRRPPPRSTLFPYTTLFRSAQGGGEFAGLFGADEARERLLEHLVLAEAQELGDGVVGLQDLALEVGHEHRTGGVLAQTLGVGPRLIQLTHVPHDAYGPAHPA